MKAWIALLAVLPITVDAFCPRSIQFSPMKSSSLSGWSNLAQEWAARNQDSDTSSFDSPQTNQLMMDLDNSDQDTSFTYAQLQDMEGQIMDLLSRKQTKSAEYDQYRQDAHQQLSSANGEKENIRKQLEQEIHMLQTQLQESKASLSQESQRAVSLLESKDQLQQEYNSLKQESASKVKSIQNKYEDEIAKRTQELDEARQMVENLMKDGKGDSQFVQYTLGMMDKSMEIFDAEAKLGDTFSQLKFREDQVLALQENNELLQAVVDDYQRLLNEISSTVQVETSRVNPVQIGKKVVETINSLRQENANYKADLQKTRQEAAAKQKELEQSLYNLNQQFEYFKEDIMYNNTGPVEEAQFLMEQMQERMETLSYYLDEQITLTKKEEEKSRVATSQKEEAEKALKKAKEAADKKVADMKKRLEEERAGRLKDRESTEAYTKEKLKGTKSSGEPRISARRKTVNEFGGIVKSLNNDLAERERDLLRLRNGIIVVAAGAVVTILLSLAAEREALEPDTPKLKASVTQMNPKFATTSKNSAAEAIKPSPKITPLPRTVKPAAVQAEKPSPKLTPKPRPGFKPAAKSDERVEFEEFSPESKQQAKQEASAPAIFSTKDPEIDWGKYTSDYVKSLNEK